MSSKWKTDSIIRTGIRHRDEAKPCQDYVKIISYPNGDIYGGLSDGISSLENSELASEICVTEGGKALHKLFADDETLRELTSSHGEQLNSILEDISETMTQHIQKSLADVPHADTTYAFVYIMREHYALVGYIGDSCVCVFSNGQAAALTQTRDYGGATESIRNPKASQLMELHLIDLNECRIDAFLLSSDGMEDVLYTKGDEGHVLHDSQLYVNSLFEKQGHEMLEDMIDKICADGCYDDDISLALLARNKVTVPHDPTWLCSCGARNSLSNAAFCEHCSSDVLELYKNAPIRDFKSLWELFRYLNAHPDEERQIVGLPEPPRQIDMTPNIQLLEKGRDKFGRRTKSNEETREPAHQKKTPKAAGHRKATRRHRFQSRLAVTGAAALILVSGMTTVAFFQSLSTSHAIEEIQSEVDSLREEIGALRLELNKATPSEAEPIIQATTESNESSSLNETIKPAYESDYADDGILTEEYYYY